MELPIEIRGDGTVVLRLHVQPGAGRTAVVGAHGEALKVAVAAPADRGRANDAVCALVAELLGVPKRDVAVVAGHTSRGKRIAVTGVAPDSVRDRLREVYRPPLP